MAKLCPRCSAPMELKALDRIRAEDKPLALVVTRMPAQKCTKGHASPVDREFMLWLIQEIKARAASLPGAEEKGLLMKKYLCACGKELAAKPEKHQAFPFDLAYQGAAPFKVEIDMPVYRCAGCGKEQLRSAKEVQKHTAQAIMSLNDAAGFPHSS